MPDHNAPRETAQTRQCDRKQGLTKNEFSFIPLSTSPVDVFCFFSVCCFLIFSCHFEYERPRLGGTKNACFTLWLSSAGLNNIIQGSGMLYERGPAFLSFIATCALMFSLRAAQE